MDNITLTYTTIPPIDSNITIIVLFYLLSFVFYLLDVSNKISQESIPQSYGILLGLLLGWGFSMWEQISQNPMALFLIVCLISLLAYAFFTSSKHKQIQNINDIDYIIRAVSYENHKMLKTILQQMGKTAKEIKDAIEQSKHEGG